MQKSVFVALMCAVWFMAFFSGWYSLSYTKVWELKQLLGREKHLQMEVMHPEQMSSLLRFREEILSMSDSDKYRVVVEVANLTDIPLAGNAQIIRAVVYPIPVIRVPYCNQLDSKLKYIMIISSTQPEPDQSSCNVISQVWRISP